jgi:HEPN domain-containing protein
VVAAPSTASPVEIPRALIEAIVARFSPEQVWLFGSRARGDARAHSDWDLLVVLPDGAPDEWLDAGLDAAGATPSDIVLVRRNDFETMRRYAGSLCRTVALEGVLVHGDPVPPNPIALGYLQAAGEDIDAARRLLAPPASRLASYHLQQAAEKLTKAVLSARGVHTTREHRVAILAAQLEQGDPWRRRLLAHARLDRFATSFRYPGTTGRLPPGEDADQAQSQVEALSQLLDEARGEVGVGR